MTYLEYLDEEEIKDGWHSHNKSYFLLEHNLIINSESAIFDFCSSIRDSPIIVHNSPIPSSIPSLSLFWEGPKLAWDS